MGAGLLAGDAFRATGSGPTLVLLRYFDLHEYRIAIRPVASVTGATLGKCLSRHEADCLHFAGRDDALSFIESIRLAASQMREGVMP